MCKLLSHRPIHVYFQLGALRIQNLRRTHVLIPQRITRFLSYSVQYRKTGCVRLDKRVDVGYTGWAQIKVVLPFKREVKLYLYHVNEMDAQAYRACRAYLSVLSIQLKRAGRIWVKFRMEVMPLRSTQKSCFCVSYKR